MYKERIEKFMDFYLKQNLAIWIQMVIYEHIIIECCSTSFLIRFVHFSMIYYFDVNLFQMNYFGKIAI